MLAHGLEFRYSSRPSIGEARFDRDLLCHVLDQLDEVEDRVVASQKPEADESTASATIAEDGELWPERRGHGHRCASTPPILTSC